VDGYQIGAVLDDLNARGLLAFVREGEVLLKGLGFKRWPVDGDTPDAGFNVTAYLMGDGFRMRMVVRPGQDPLFELLIDNPNFLTGKVTRSAVFDALKSPGLSRLQFLAACIEEELAAERTRSRAPERDSQQAALLLRDLGAFQARLAADQVDLPPDAARILSDNIGALMDDQPRRPKAEDDDGR
jgi:hypothetical protein